MPRLHKREREERPRPLQKRQQSAKLPRQNTRQRFLHQSKMTTVTVRSLEEGPECDGTVVTLDNFRSWKRKCGKHTGFVVQMPAVDGDGVLISTFADMNDKLPLGDYQAQLVRRCAIPGVAKKDLRGTDIWKCV